MMEMLRNNPFLFVTFFIVCPYAGLSVLVMQSKGIKGLTIFTILGWIVCSLVLVWFFAATETWGDPQAIRNIFLVSFFAIWLPLIAMSFSAYGTHEIFPQISIGVMVIKYIVTIIIGTILFPIFSILLLFSGILFTIIFKQQLFSF
jgi:hypothetical protein